MSFNAHLLTGYKIVVIIAKQRHAHLCFLKNQLERTKYEFYLQRFSVVNSVIFISFLNLCGYF